MENVPLVAVGTIIIEFTRIARNNFLNFITRYLRNGRHGMRSQIIFTMCSLYLSPVSYSNINNYPWFFFFFLFTTLLSRW